MKKFFKKIKNLTGVQYFLVSLLSIPILLSGVFLVTNYAIFLEKFINIDLVLGVVLIATYLVLSIQGVIALFGALSLKDRIWVWLGLGINLFMLYVLIFAGSDLPLPLI